jgi:hypothetical protein
MAAPPAVARAISAAAACTAHSGIPTTLVAVGTMPSVCVSARSPMTSRCTDSYKKYGTMQVRWRAD